MRYDPRCVAYSAEPEAVGRKATRLLSRGMLAMRNSSISLVSPNENSPPPIRTSSCGENASGSVRSFTAVRRPYRLVRLEKRIIWAGGLPERVREAGAATRTNPRKPERVARLPEAPQAG